MAWESRVPRDVSDYGDPRDHSAKCDICPLKGSRHVPALLPAGGRKPKLIIVGEGPGYSEGVMRTPFVGKTGKFLDSTLEGVGIQRDEVVLTNAEMCLPQSDKDAERAAECCAPRLLKELAGYPADVPIMALGKAAARSVLGVRSILLARGFIWTARSLENPIKSVDAALRKAEREKKPLGDLLLRKEILEGRQAIAGRTVLPTVHPAFVLRSDVWTPIMNIDFQRAADWVSGKLGPADLIDETRKYVVVEKLKDVKRELALLGPTVSCDIETGKDVTIKGSTGKNPITAKILCTGLSDGERTMVIGPWRKEVHAKLLTQALANRTVSFHNGFCVHADTLVVLADGTTRKISKIVNGQERPTVMSLGADGKIKPAQVTGWSKTKQPGQRWVRVRVAGQPHGMTVTPDHLVFTDRGWVEAGEIRRGDSVAQVEPQLSGEMAMALIGTLLGDSSMMLFGHTAKITGGQAEKSGLSRHKAEVMPFIRTGKAYRPKSNFANADMVIPYKTSCSREILKLRRAVYDRQGRKRLRPSTLNALGRIGLAWWFMDDGSLCKRSNEKARDRVLFATNCFLRIDVRGAARWFVKNFGGHAWANKDLTLTLEAETAERFCEYIAPCVPDIMRYKFPRHRDWPAYVYRQLVETTLPQFAEVISIDNDYRAACWSTPAGKGLGETRYCLKVAETENFFTVNGLVHNCFDHIALERDGVKLDLSRVEDTLMAHHAFASHFPQRLDHVVSVFLPACTPWKIKHGMRGGAEEKGLLPDDMTLEDLAGYNASDAVLQARTWNAIQEDLAPEMGVYQHDKQLAALCKEMYVVGIRRDEAHAQALSKKMKRRRNALRREMRTLTRRKNFYPSHLDDVRKALKNLGVGTLFVTATGLVSTASATMEAIATADTHAGRFATLMLKWRAVEKARSTYIDAPDIQALADGRFHPNWKPFGTVTGRLASRAQSMPRLVLTDRAKKLLKKNPKWKTKDVEAEIGRDATYEIESRVREIYVPADGHEFKYFDLCFAAGTMIDGPVGAKPIETMNVGDLVYTYRKSTRKPAVGKVTERVFVGRKPIVKVTLDNGEVVRCTPEHKWLVCPRFQKDDPVERLASELRYGDRLLPLRKIINRGSWRYPAAPREYLYAHSAALSSATHVEVALTVHGPRPDGHHTHHKDDNAMNNAPDNLEYKLESEHIADHGRERALAQWADPMKRVTIHESLRANGEKWRKEGRFAGKNNPRFGDRRQRRKKKCEQCGRKFEFFASNSGSKWDRRFCSKKCDIAAKAVKKKCLRCGEPTKRTRTKFCSRSCWKLGLAEGLNHRVVDVVPDGYADVWSIGVDPDHNYALAAGVFVKNSQSEMRAAAYLSGDDNFIKSCESGDVHTANAKILFPSALEILNRDPKGEGKQLRDITKNAGFGILYKAAAQTIFAFLRAQGFPVELEQVEAMFAFIYQHYARYYEYCEERFQECCQNGFLRTALMKRIRWLGFFPEPTIVYNFSVQSFIADLMNLRLIELRKRLPKSACPVFQGHDSVATQVRSGPDADLTERLIKELWAEPIFVPTSGRTFVMPIDLHSGNRLSDF